MIGFVIVIDTHYLT